MSDFENYPYNEQHELNLDPTLKEIKEDKTTAENANKRVDGVEDTINNDNKKLDDANAKADAINQNADNFVDQSNTRINDIENNADNSVNDINKKADDISDKADDLDEKITDNADKVDDINNKQNETKAQVDNSVSNAYYENELTPEEMQSAKKMGVLKVAKASGITSNEINTVTPSGALGNCVVWSSSPFTFVNTNPQILTDQDFSTEGRIIQYQCSGSFYAFYSFNKSDDKFVVCSNGHMYAGDRYGSDFFTSNMLVTNKHLDFYISGNTPSASDKFTIILPKTDAHTWDGGYEQFTVSANQTGNVTTKPVPFANHVYFYYVVYESSGYNILRGYIYNGSLINQYNKIYYDAGVLDAEYSDNTFNLKIVKANENFSVRNFYFVDLGEM